MATLAAYTYDSAGRRASRTLSNGLITGYTYNVRGELTSAAIGDGTNPPLWRNDYGYNTVGNRTWTRYGDSSALGDAYTYDATDQVIGVKYDAESVSSGYASATNAVFAALWTYDAAGNRITEAVSGTAIPARPAATAYTTNDINQYTGLVEDSVSRSLTYSARGDLAAWNGWTLSNDSFGRVRKATDGSATHWHQYTVTTGV